jgi:hypothetical protein
METEQSFTETLALFSNGPDAMARAQTVAAKKDVEIITRRTISSLTGSSTRQSFDSLVKQLYKLAGVKKRKALTQKRIRELLIELVAEDLVRVDISPDRRCGFEEKPARVWVSLNPDHFEVEARRLGYVPIEC